MKTKTKDREIISVAEMYPPTKPEYCAISRKVLPEDATEFRSRIMRHGYNLGFEWLLSPEPVPDKLLVPTFEDIIFTKAYAAVQDKASYLLQVSLLCSNISLRHCSESHSEGVTRNV